MEAVGESERQPEVAGRRREKKGRKKESRGERKKRVEEREKIEAGRETVTNITYVTIQISSKYHKIDVVM